VGIPIEKVGVFIKVVGKAMMSQFKPVRALAMLLNLE